MDLKIGKHLCPNITEKDWVLAGGTAYLVKSRCYKEFTNRVPRTVCAVMPAEQFVKLTREGVLVRDYEREASSSWKNSYGKHEKYEAWRFNLKAGGKKE